MQGSFMTDGELPELMVSTTVIVIAGDHTGPIIPHQTFASDRNRGVKGKRCVRFKPS